MKTKIGKDYSKALSPKTAKTPHEYTHTDGILTQSQTSYILEQKILLAIKLASVYPGLVTLNYLVLDTFLRSFKE